MVISWTNYHLRHHRNGGEYTLSASTFPVQITKNIFISLMKNVTTAIAVNKKKQAKATST